jgi:hypothetical protein
MSAARFVRVSPTRIACPHVPDLTLVRFDFERSRRRFAIQLADIEAPELGPSDRSYACLLAAGVSSWRRGANGLRGCDEAFHAALDGEGTVRDIVVQLVGDERVSMRIELWDSLGWIQLEAAACRAYLRGSYIEPVGELRQEVGEPGEMRGPHAVGSAEPESQEPSRAVVHRDLRSGEPFDPESPFDEILLEG